MTFEDSPDPTAAPPSLDAVDGESGGALAGALPPAAAARDNARRGTWMMNEQFDGWVLLGADRKPVMRADRSRVGFRFADAARPAGEPPDTRGAAHDLAPLDSGFNGDWDPQVPRSYLADLTKMVKLLAYHHVQTTEPQEAVRRAVSDVFGNPVYVDEPGTNAWVPGKFDMTAVKSTAAALMRQALGPEPGDGEGGGALGGMAAPGGRTVRGMPRDRRNLGANFVKAGATSEQANPAGVETQPAQAGGDIPKAPPGVDIDANIAEARKYRRVKFWFYNQVNSNGPWDYKRQSRDYEDFGNFNYGATGAAVGYTEAVLLRVAGWKHVRDGNHRPEFGVAPSLPEALLGIGGKPPFGDDPRDQLQISRGYQYYQHYRERK